MRKFILLCCLMFVPSIVSAQEDYSSRLKHYDTDFVIYDRSSGSRIHENPSITGRRLPPCSTFKIYNTLIGLELGLLKGPDDPWYEWDGVQRAIEGWNQDLTLRQAFRASAVPAFQNLAREIGLERMKQYIGEINYGTAIISADVDRFWLPSENYTPIQISADEQVDLLNALLDGNLPFDKNSIAILKDIMRVAETEKGVLYGKTGSGQGADGNWNLGWFVGFLESHGKVYVFACNMTGGDTPSGIIARKLAEEYFRARGLL